ncbi:hypothetical protein KAH55_12690, partial [bacterium]|nr:hypothetical protein [bacterium]
MNVSQAGWASVDITPEIGIPLGGRGPQFAEITHVIDPLFVQALVLEDPTGQRVLFISLDLVGIGTVFSLDLRFQLATLTGVPHEAVVLNFSHTHSGPMTIMDKYPVQQPIPENLAIYQQRLFDSVIDVALQAVANMQPAEMEIHRGTSTIGINRRNYGPAGKVEMRPNKDGFFNPDVWVLDVKAANGERCVAFNYGCHAVTVYGWQWQACSADYPGAARQFVRQALGDGVHAQFLQGFGGNIRPRQLSDFENNQFRSAVENEHVEIGAELGRDVLQALDQPGERLELELAAAAGRFQAWRD